MLGEGSEGVRSRGSCRVGVGRGEGEVQGEYRVVGLVRCRVQGTAG